MDREPDSTRTGERRLADKRVSRIRTDSAGATSSTTHVAGSEQCCECCRPHAGRPGRGCTLETLGLPRPHQGETGNLRSSLTTSDKIEAVIEKCPTNTSPGPKASQANSTKHSKVIIYSSKLFQNAEEGGRYSNSLYEAAITLTPEPGTTKKKIIGQFLDKQR